MSAVDFALWWGIRDFILWWSVRALFSFRGLALGVTVGRLVVK